jgi:DNA-binding NtrC family response regulator
MRPDATRCLLLIDDEPAQRRLVSAIGARAGWWVMGAPDVEAATRLLAEEQGADVDAILLDHWLPGEEGNRLIDQLRSVRPELPLLILTSQSSVSVAVDAMRAGGQRFPREAAIARPIARRPQRRDRSPQEPRRAPPAF